MPNKTARRRFNLDSPNSIQSACDLANLIDWFREELARLRSEVERDLLQLVASHFPEFVRWATLAVLLRSGWDRTQRYFRFPELLKLAAKTRNLRLDGRQNGPAILAFGIAGGERPARHG